ncbi:DUF2812 domain-containing protein [Anaerotignum sp.]|uniref:DUF2812 domain-containing protein n=1 Tax=Anaerotignum sp. TaxID=2039241 RepID=UPI002A91077E|nr:DUF2812 domain-containing protein [Anaerotignum sp.]MCI7656771.1 DUF2812 domain-containing protein [Clostridia bacterium]MDY5416089.1 DUF2812 domain-containing protein [Anaerotignum sp.]
MTYIRRLIPCAPYEIKTFEAWLEELAQEEGLFLISCRRAFAKFEKGTPKPMRYRVDADPDRCWDPSQERRQLYEEFGWKYIDNRSEHLVVYGTDDFSLPELHTDPELQMEAFGKLQKKSLLHIAAVFLFLLLVMCLHIFTGRWISWLRHSNSILVLFLLLVLYFLDVTKEYRSVQKLKKQLKAEQSSPEPADFYATRKKLYLRICYRITVDVLCLVALLTPLWMRNFEEHISLSAYSGEELPILSPAVFGCDAESTKVSLSYYTSFLAPVQYDIFQFGEDFYLDTQYFQCKTDFLSRSISRNYLITTANGNLTEMENQTLDDGTEITYRATNSRQYLVIQKGTDILLLETYSEIDLWENREKFYPLLDKTYPLPKET